jgi:hypothetical protein
VPNVIVSVPGIPSENNKIISDKKNKPIIDINPVETAKPSIVPIPETIKTADVIAANIKVSTNWRQGFASSKKVSVQADLKVNPEDNITTVQLSINNNSEDELELLNRTDNPDLLSIKDNLGNDYTNKVDIRSVSSELIRIYPNSVARGSFIMNTITNPQAKSLVISLSEYEGKKRNFYITLEKESP